MQEYYLEELIIKYDNKRKPLSTMVRNKLEKIYPYYGANGIIDYVDDYIFDGEYLLLAEDGTVLIDNKYPVIYETSGKFWVSNHAHVFKANEEIVMQKFLYYILKNTIINDKITGTTQLKLSQENMNKIVVSIPDIPTQKKIVDLLYTIDKKIDINNNIINELYDLGDCIYNEKIKSSDSAVLVKLENIIEIFDSKRKPMSSREREKHKGIYPYYGATSIIDYVDDYIFDGEYLLMGEDGTVKTKEGFPVLQYIWGKNWINNHAHVLKGKNISTEYLLFILRKQNIENIITGAVQPKINQENMNNLEVYIGDEIVNNEVDKSFVSIINKIRNTIEENIHLAKLRDDTLKEFMKGELKLDNF